MSRLKSRRPSPALLVAVFALVAALAGTAIAGPTATTSINKKKTKKISRQQAKKQINKTLPIGAEDTSDVSTQQQTINLTANVAQQVSVNCEEDQKLLSGGARFDQAPQNTNNLEIQASYKSNNGWTAVARTNQNNRPFTVYAYCLTG